VADKLVSDYPINENAFALRDLLARTLETTVAVFESYGVPLPSRQYWCIGAPAEDCEQVVVSLVQTYLGIPGDQASEVQNCNSPRTAVINIHVTRNVIVGESGRAVRPERIISSAEWVAVDTWVLMSEMQQFDMDSLGMRGPGVIATVNSTPPNGAVQTTTLNLSVAVL